MQNPLKGVFAKLDKNPFAKGMIVVALVFLGFFFGIALRHAVTMDNSFRPGTGMTVVEITHIGLFSSSGVKFSCTSAQTDYITREVIMSDVCQIGAVGGSRWVGSFFMRGDKVIVVLDPDEKYKIQIGKIRCSMK